MTNPSLYRDDSRVRHMLDAMQRIAELSKDLDRAQLRKHGDAAEMILFNMMVLGEAANNITREFAEKHPEVDWKGLAGVRHKIVHDYADVDYDIIWDILRHDIADQYEKVKAIADTLPPEPTVPPSNIADFL